MHADDDGLELSV